MQILYLKVLMSSWHQWLHVYDLHLCRQVWKRPLNINAVVYIRFVFEFALKKAQKRMCFKRQCWFIRNPWECDEEPMHSAKKSTFWRNDHKLQRQHARTDCKPLQINFVNEQHNFSITKLNWFAVTSFRQLLVNFVSFSKNCKNRH